MDLTAWIRKNAEVQQQQQQQQQQNPQQHPQQYLQQHPQQHSQHPHSGNPTSHALPSNPSTNPTVQPAQSSQASALTNDTQHTTQNQQALRGQPSVSMAGQRAQPAGSASSASKALSTPGQANMQGSTSSSTSLPPTQFPYQTGGSNGDSPNFSAASSTGNTGISSSQIAQGIQSNVAALQRQWSLVNAQPDGPNKTAAQQYLTGQMLRLRAMHDQAMSQRSDDKSQNANLSGAQHPGAQVGSPGTPSHAYQGYGMPSSFSSIPPQQSDSGAFLSPHTTAHRGSDTPDATSHSATSNVSGVGPNPGSGSNTMSNAMNNFQQYNALNHNGGHSASYPTGTPPSGQPGNPATHYGTQPQYAMPNANSLASMQASMRMQQMTQNQAASMQSLPPHIQQQLQQQQPGSVGSPHGMYGGMMQPPLQRQASQPPGGSRTQTTNYHQVAQRAPTPSSNSAHGSQTSSRSQVGQTSTPPNPPAYPPQASSTAPNNFAQGGIPAHMYAQRSSTGSIPSPTSPNQARMPTPTTMQPPGAYNANAAKRYPTPSGGNSGNSTDQGAQDNLQSSNQWNRNLAGSNTLPPRSASQPNNAMASAVTAALAQGIAFPSIVHALLLQSGVKPPADLDTPFVGPAASGQREEKRSIDMQQLFWKVIQSGGSEYLATIPNGWATIASQLDLALHIPNQSPNMNDVPQQLASYYQQRLGVFEKFWFNAQQRTAQDSDVRAPTLSNEAKQSTPQPASQAQQASHAPGLERNTPTTLPGTMPFAPSSTPNAAMEPAEMQATIAHHMSQLQGLVASGQMSAQQAMAQYNALQQAMQSYNAERAKDKANTPRSQASPQLPGNWTPINAASSHPPQNTQSAWRPGGGSGNIPSESSPAKQLDSSNTAAGSMPQWQANVPRIESLQSNPAAQQALQLIQRGGLNPTQYGIALAIVRSALGQSNQAPSATPQQQAASIPRNESMFGIAQTPAENAVNVKSAQEPQASQGSQAFSTSATQGITAGKQGDVSSTQTAQQSHSNEHVPAPPANLLSEATSSSANTKQRSSQNLDLGSPSMHAPGKNGTPPMNFGSDTKQDSRHSSLPSTATGDASGTTPKPNDTPNQSQASSQAAKGSIQPQATAAQTNEALPTYEIQYLPWHMNLTTHGGRDLHRLDRELVPRLAAYSRPRGVHELGTVDITALTLSLESRLVHEMSYALNTLLILSAAIDAPSSFSVPLASCDRLLDVLLDILIENAFGSSASCENTSHTDRLALQAHGVLGEQCSYCTAVEFALEDESQMRVFRRAHGQATNDTSQQSAAEPSSSASEQTEEQMHDDANAQYHPDQEWTGDQERAADQRVSIALTVLVILRNVSVMPDNTSFLAQHPRFLSCIARLARAAQNDPRWQTKTNSQESQVDVLREFSLVELLQIRKDLLTIVLGVATEQLDLSEHTPLTSASLFDLLRFFVLDANEFEARYGATPFALERLAQNSALSRTTLQALMYQAPQHARLALQALSCFALPDSNREVLARHVPGPILLELANALIAMIPVDMTDFRRLGSVTRLEYVETAASCLFNIAYLAPPSVKISLRDTPGVPQVLFRAIRRLLQSAPDYIRNPYGVLCRRLLATLRLLSDSEDVFGSAPLQGMYWPPLGDQDTRAQSKSEANVKSPTKVSLGLFVDQDDAVLDWLVRTPNVEAHVAAELLSLV
ncbi:hypothetical protein MPSI1_002236 [Malassezia psittaci]|uniref:ARID domain-containing protein n=1 Tax=Malassezia psittaci TaxID=1821823 RepID=A0AAF0JED1_9BASI|nr:hypothetical protein MPSI1_002236 [Malassezia psittaci]